MKHILIGKNNKVKYLFNDRFLMLYHFTIYFMFYINLIYVICWKILINESTFGPYIYF